MNAGASVKGGGARGAIAPPLFGRIEGAATPWARASNNVKKLQSQICRKLEFFFFDRDFTSWS